MSAKRENGLEEASFEKLRACGAFAGEGARGPNKSLDASLVSCAASDRGNSHSALHNHHSRM